MSVKVYSTPNCPACITVKKYLQGKHIAYQDIDVSKDRNAAMEMVKKSGQRGVPVIDINGHMIVGFNQTEIDRLIKM